MQPPFPPLSQKILDGQTDLLMSGNILGFLFKNTQQDTESTHQDTE